MVLGNSRIHKEVKMQLRITEEHKGLSRRKLVGYIALASSHHCFLIIPFLSFPFPLQVTLLCEPGILLKKGCHLFHILHNIAVLLGLNAKWRKHIHKQNVII